MTTTQGTQAQGALRGVQVLDFGQYIPGPMLGMLLSDQGADVIKVERPGGDPARSEPAFATWNRGKRSAVLDLKTPEGQATAQALAKKADIVIENYRPGVAERLGIGYETLTKENPRLLYCSIPGFGEDSPHRNERGWEGIVSASTGTYQPYDQSEEPLFLPLPTASTFAAIVASVSVTMALIARDRTGKGQRIEVPMHSAMFSAIGRHLVKLYDINPPDMFDLPRNVMAHQYQCADGRYIQSQGMYQVFVSQLMTAANRPEWIEDLEDLYGADVSPETIAMWKDRFEKMFMERSAFQWEEDIAAARGVGTVCKTIEEWLVHEHAIAGKMVVEVDDSEHGTMKQPGVQVRLRGTPGAIQGRAPTLGEHTAEILAEVAQVDEGPGRPVTFPEAEENIMGALEGIRVLDLCIVLAGPTCGRTLGEFGAEVIKIDDPSRPYDIAGNTDVNRGKRSININLKTPEGLEVFYKLLETADVVVENNRASSLARLGISYEEMKKRKPDIIHASLNAFGYDGPWAERPGWEQLAQATSGIQVRRGGRDAAPKILPYPMNDYGTGLMGAYAVALAVHERNRTGEGQTVNSGLALTAGLLQSPFFLDYEGYQRDEPEGLDVRGFSAKSRLYEAADGWMYLHCPSDEAWANLMELSEFTGLDEGSDDALTQSLVKILAGKPRAEWEKLINPTGVSVMANRMVADFRDDADIRKAGLIVGRDHPGVGQADHLGSVAKLSETPMRVGRPTPLLGAETDEILVEAGYTGEQIQAMKLSGAVVQHRA